MKQQYDMNDVKTFRRTLRKLEREFNSQLRERVECCGISVIQCHTLLEIEDREICSMKEIAEYFRIDKSTISRTVDILVIKGYVSRIENEQNRRYLDLKLTEEGSKLCKNINSICDGFYTDLLSHIPGEKMKGLFDSFTLFTKALRITDEQSKFTQNNCVCSGSERN